MVQRFYCTLDCGMYSIFSMRVYAHYYAVGVCVATIYYNAETRNGGGEQNWRRTCKFLTGLRSALGQPPPEKAEGFLWPLRSLSSDGCC